MHFLPILLLLVAPPESFTAKVVGVKDGDSIVVLHNRKEVVVRLHGIDTPEFGQDFGSQAKKQTSDLCFGKMVTVHVKGTDRYDRTLGEVLLPDGRSLNHELVRAGYAWWYRQYSKDETLGELEAEARKGKLGLWSGKDPLAPWEWRERKREKVPALQK